MINITSHVLNTAIGKPAEGIVVYLYRLHQAGTWLEISRSITNKDGRIPGFELTDDELMPGIYKLMFETGNYFTQQELVSFYPFIEIVFEAAADEHYHVPLLLNPFGYSTYRGS